MASPFAANKRVVKLFKIGLAPGKCCCFTLLISKIMPIGIDEIKWNGKDLFEIELSQK